MLDDIRGEVAEAEHWWRRAAEAGESDAMDHLALLLKARGHTAGAEQWCRRAADLWGSRTRPPFLTSASTRLARIR
jgi:TPR repeat protein